MDVDEDARVKLAYDEGLRMLDCQRASIDEVRARAGVILAGGSIVAAVLGADVLKGTGRMGRFGWLGVLSFVILTVATIAVRWPVEWKFLTGPEQLLDIYVFGDEPFTIDQTRVDLARKMNQRYRDNEKKTERLFAGLTVSLVALAAEVLFLLAELHWS